MPYLRFSRDKRGYEHTYLIHEVGGRGRPTRLRVLYWFRTPPGVRVGRDAFDEEAIRQIESHNPGLFFDWKTIVSTPMPPVPEVEHWRERRRVERAAKVARREEQKDVENAELQTEAAVEPVAVPEPLEPADALEPVGSLEEKTFTVVQGLADPPRKRRRRRGGRRRAAAQPESTPEDQGNRLDPAPSRLDVGIQAAEAGDTDVSDRNVEAEPSPRGPSESRSETSEE